MALPDGGGLLVSALAEAERNDIAALLFCAQNRRVEVVHHIPPDML